MNRTKGDISHFPPVRGKLKWSFGKEIFQRKKDQHRFWWYILYGTKNTGTRLGGVLACYFFLILSEKSQQKRKLWNRRRHQLFWSSERWELRGFHEKAFWRPVRQQHSHRQQPFDVLLGFYRDLLLWKISNRCRNALVAAWRLLYARLNQSPHQGCPVSCRHIVEFLTWGYLCVPRPALPQEVSCECNCEWLQLETMDTSTGVFSFLWRHKL